MMPTLNIVPTIVVPVLVAFGSFNPLFSNRTFLVMAAHVRSIRQTKPSKHDATQHDHITERLPLIQVKIETSLWWSHFECHLVAGIFNPCRLLMPGEWEEMEEEVCPAAVATCDTSVS